MVIERPLSKRDEDSIVELYNRKPPFLVTQVCIVSPPSLFLLQEIKGGRENITTFRISTPEMEELK